MTVDLSKNLDQLEGRVWGEPESDSHLVQECHRLRKVPLGDFTVENLRMVIGQKISLEFLVPLALEYLVEDPLVEGRLYRGDLLWVMAGVPNDYWKAHPDNFTIMVEIKKEVEILRDTLTGEILPALERFEF